MRIINKKTKKQLLKEKILDYSEEKLNKEVEKFLCKVLKLDIIIDDLKSVIYFNVSNDGNGVRRIIDLIVASDCPFMKMAYTNNYSDIYNHKIKLSHYEMKHDTVGSLFIRLFSEIGFMNEDVSNDALKQLCKVKQFRDSIGYILFRKHNNIAFE